MNIFSLILLFVFVIPLIAEENPIFPQVCNEDCVTISGTKLGAMDDGGDVHSR